MLHLQISFLGSDMVDALRSTMHSVDCVEGNIKSRAKFWGVLLTFTTALSTHSVNELQRI
jgi:hypothetical protein